MDEGATQHSPGPKRLGHHGQAAPSEGYYWQEAGGDRNAGSCKRTSQNTCTRSLEDTRLSAPSGCSSVLSHVVTGSLPERCMPVTYGPPARCSLSLDKSDRRLAAILTCRSTAPTTTRTKASRAPLRPYRAGALQEGHRSPRAVQGQRPALGWRKGKERKERGDEHQAA